MQKIYSMGALCAALVALSSCGGDSKQEQAAPAEAATVWSNEMTYLVNEKAKNKEVTNYGEGDVIVSVDKYDVNKETGAMELAEHIIYQNGIPVYSNVLNADGTVVGHSVFNYNESGKLTSEVIETYVEGLKKVAPSQRYVYEYNENGDVVSVTEQHAVPKGWATDYAWEYKYDEQNRLSLRQDYNGTGKERKQSCQYSFKYKEGSNQFEQVDYYFYDLKTQKLRHDSKTRYEYNNQGRLKSETVIRHKANKTRDDINSRLITYVYNADGQLTDKIEQKWNNNEKKWYDVKTYNNEYNAEGQLVQAVEAYYTNKGLKISKEIYTPAPEGKSLKAAPAPLEQIKPIINVDDKHKTSKEED